MLLGENLQSWLGKAARYQGNPVAASHTEVAGLAVETYNAGRACPGSGVASVSPVVFAGPDIDCLRTVVERIAAAFEAATMARACLNTKPGRENAWVLQDDTASGKPASAVADTSDLAFVVAFDCRTLMYYAGVAEASAYWVHAEPAFEADEQSARQLACFCHLERD